MTLPSKIGKTTAALLLMALSAVAAVAADGFRSAPVYEAKDADVSSDAVRCRRAGIPALDGEDAFVRRGFWTLANYDNRLGIEVGGVRDGAKGLCIDGSAKTCDTAWSATSGKIQLKGEGRRYRLGFSLDTTIAIKLPNSDGENWRSTIFWYGADGNEIAKTPVAYSVPKGQRTDVVQFGDTPEGAVSFALRLGFDWPNIGPANRLVFGELSFRQIGTIFGKTETWARVTYHRARLKLQERMNDHDK